MYRRRRGAPLSEQTPSDLAPSSAASEKRQLRKHMRAVRRQLEPLAQAQASNAVLTHALSRPWFASGKRVAAYWAAGSELSLKPLLALLLARGVFVYLPHVGSDGDMQFLRYHGEASLALGKNGILAPVFNADHFSAAPNLDLILLPLLAFDTQGQRLGQGGGYYDRYLQTLAADKPLRVGVAFHFQKVDCVPAEHFDKVLHAVITERGIFDFAGAP